MTTFVWIVAVERYGPVGIANNGLDIPSPIGERALSLARSIAERDPLAHIVLSYSLPTTPSYNEQIEQLSGRISQTGATQQELQNALLELEGDGTLLIYWVGHGIMVSNERMLLCADSRDLSNLRAIDVDSLLTRLRSDVFPRCQIGFFDACAQVVQASEVLRFEGPGDIPTEQYFYFSAAAAEVVAASTSTSGFSGSVIDLLIDSQREFPPQPAPLFAELQRRLDQSPLSTRAFLLQRTTGSGDMWDYLGGERENVSRSFARAARCSLREFDYLRSAIANSVVDNQRLCDALRHNSMDALLNELNQVGSQTPRVHGQVLHDAWQRLQLARELESLCQRIGLSWSDWQELCQQIVAIDNLDALSSDSLASLLVGLLDQMNLERGLDSCIRLLALAARRARSKVPANARDFEAQARGMAQLAPRWDGAVASLPRMDGPVFLLLGLQYAEATKVLSLAGSWLYQDDEIDPSWQVSSNAERLIEQINELIQIAKIKYRRQLIVELLAPNDLLCSPRELFELVDNELGTSTWLEAQCALVLRWHDRMKGPPRFQPGNWLQQSEIKLNYVATNPDLDIDWPNELQRGHIVGLPFPGPSLVEPNRNRSSFFGALLKGDPWMCWPRIEPSEPSKFKQKVREFIQHHGVSQATRPYILAEALRQERSNDQDPVLCSLWLFIDDPSRNPYGWNFTETTQRTIS
ncbi:hypothetical protein [Herbaspirillum rubrisubalbicans]|uniref:vWA-MoxR associated protein middle region 20 domain-containing protein n=1 Tax=Herbaspirillum rubrisubalbicans TaxID=80842 RepID=A0AAD0U726_9BURK|nr:hypothetical protein [Herbaspirillum rubrisubalbicans]AYR24508.1 hypothetical protein RC54_11990 [Herbaspirillum rubrisubalbicans]